MKNLMRIFTVCCVLFCAAQAQAQEYKSAVGLRFGIPTSISYKTMLSEKNGVELNVGTRGRNYNGILGSSGWRYFSATAAYLIHNDLEIEGLEGLRYYYGVGAGVAFYTFNDDFLSNEFNSLNVLLQGYLGLEYTFADTPISITTDWVPTFIIGDFDDGFTAGYGALGIRYVFQR